MTHSRRAICLLVLSSAAFAAEVPAGALWEARLSAALSSFNSKKGQRIEAVVLTPPGHRAAAPKGARLIGELAEAKRVGFGIRRGRAMLKPVFHTLLLPDGEAIPIEARLTGLDNARETVDEKGRILGIRATSVFGHRMAGITRNIFFWDPLIQTVLAGTTIATLRFPESEIHLPAGSEFHVRLQKPVALRDDLTVPLPPVVMPGDGEDLAAIVSRLSHTTIDAKTNKGADLVNLLLLGESEWLERAFRAAGWVVADPLTKATGWKTFRSVAEALPYPEAPMSKQLLDESPPELELSKTINNYSQRHHARVFTQKETFRGRPLHAGSATHDVAVDFLFGRMKLTHLIDDDIDRERGKLVNDLIATGCVDAAELIDRPWAPREHRNTSGQKLITDGRIAVLELNPCRTPLRAMEPEPAPKPSIWRRIPRQFFLTVRNDFTHNNPVVQTGLGVKYLWKKMTGRKVTPQALSR
ncbi:MAG: LssY C-terminal domain-containing protein [Bryobacteraceae bacterium]|nr:LssY C-terminal domain-containing protein [Bryobacteraceae bacterium]